MSSVLSYFWPLPQKRLFITRFFSRKYKLLVYFNDLTYFNFPKNPPSSFQIKIWLLLPAAETVYVSNKALWNFITTKCLHVPLFTIMYTKNRNYAICISILIVFSPVPRPVHSFIKQTCIEHLKTPCQETPLLTGFPL